MARRVAQVGVDSHVNYVIVTTGYVLMLWYLDDNRTLGTQGPTIRELFFFF